MPCRAFCFQSFQGGTNETTALSSLRALQEPDHHSYVRCHMAKAPAIILSISSCRACPAMMCCPLASYIPRTPTHRYACALPSACETLLAVQVRWTISLDFKLSSSLAHQHALHTGHCRSSWRHDIKTQQSTFVKLSFLSCFFLLRLLSRRPEHAAA